MIQMENNLVMDMKSAATKKRKKKQSSNRGSRNRGGGGGNYKGISEPMRVVYISNPMKFEIRASEFRRLVQQLTGRDAEFPPSLHRHHINPPAAASNSSSDSSSNCSSLTTTTTATVDSSVGGGHNVAPSPEEEDHDAPPLAMVGEVEDEDQWDDGEFAPEMLENTAVFHSWHFDLDFAELINS